MAVISFFTTFPLMQVIEYPLEDGAEAIGFGVDFINVPVSLIFTIGLEYVNPYAPR